MSEEKYNFGIGDEVVFNNLEDAEKFEVVSISDRGFTLGVKSRKGFHREKTQFIDASLTIKTGRQIDRTSLSDILSVPKRKGE